ncbi:MAG: hypothetical protein ACOCZJ_02410 [Thermoplasmatota archaeon]
MGFSVAGAGGIVFVALIVAASIMSGVVFTSLEDIEESAETNVDDWVRKGQTTFTIQNILYNRTNNELTITVKNTGATVLNASKIDILKNGEMVNKNNINVDVVNKDGNRWPPEENIKISIDDADLKFYQSISERVDEKLRTGISNPGSISTNSNYTYIVDGENVVIYDYHNTYKKELSDGLIDDAVDLTSTYRNLYVLDNYTDIDRYDEVGNNGVNFIPEGGENSNPKSISVTDENTNNHLYVLDNNTHIDKYDLDGTFNETVVTDLQGAIDLYVTDHIHVINSTFNSIERYTLDGSSHTTLTHGGELADPTNITVSDQNFASQYIYIVDSNDHIDVYDTDGNFVTTIEEQMGSNLKGLDIAGRLYVSNGLNGVYRFNIGTKIKVVLENAIADYKTT